MAPSFSDCRAKPRETIEKTIDFAKEINPHTIQVSLAAPYPGTTLYKQAVENGWLQENDAVNLVNDKGVQLAAISYPHLSKEEIFHSMEVFYKRFYFRPGKIWEIVKEMLTSWDMMTRRLREGRRVLPLPASARGLRRQRSGTPCRPYIRS